MLRGLVREIGASHEHALRGVQFGFHLLGLRLWVHLAVVLLDGLADARPHLQEALLREQSALLLLVYEQPERSLDRE